MPQIDEKYYTITRDAQIEKMKLLLIAGASHNACLHIDSLSFDDVIIPLTVFEMSCSVF